MRATARPNLPRTILSAGAVLALFLAFPAALSRAGRGPADRGPSARDRQMEAQMAGRFPRFRAVERPAGLSPLGDDFRPIFAEGAEGRGLVVTPVGHLDLHVPEALLGRLPAALRFDAADLETIPGRGRHRGDGPHLLQVREDAVRGAGAAAIEAEIRARAAILSFLPERAFVVRPRAAGGLRDLARLDFVEAIEPYHPGFRIDPRVGRMPLLSRARALDRTLELVVSVWPGIDPERALAAVRGAAGEGNAAPFGLDGSAFLVRTTTPRIALLARLPEVAAIQERLEFVLNNSEVPTVMMIGSWDQGLGGARPYHDLGIDGGGIDTGTQGGSPTAPDGQRLNDGSDAVPPQIVAVTDNGISVDSVGFSQTAAAVETTDNPIGPAHRKVHAMHEVRDSGNTCDGLLAGSGTHGNVVAGIIAAHPGSLGFAYTRPSTEAGAPITGISMDALARGARILMQDAATPGMCTANEILENGGNVDPGNLLDRMNQAICPRSGGTGACANVVGGGGDLHLHVMPFGVPNFDNSPINAANGTYTLESRQIDLFLVNNLDYMVFSPVGNQGFAQGAAEVLWPDLFDGTAADNDPNVPQPLQIPPPATAKNSVTVGGVWADAATASDIYTEELAHDYSSKGPATSLSLRTAPLVVSVMADGSGYFGYPLFQEPAVPRSRDNDNLLPVENEIDDQNFGTSFASAYVAAAGAIVRDYFAQGFYPTALRDASDRNPQVSGSLVRAALVAGTNFAETYNEAPRSRTDDRTLANARAVDLETISGVPVGIMGNNIQGYGRVVLDYVLPLPNYPVSRAVGRRTREHPAAGLIVHDTLATGEPPIDNAGRTATEKTFLVDGVDTTVDPQTGTRAIAGGQLRIALAWADPPSAALSGGTLINDLDLEVESPGPDNDIGTTADNVVYDGNVYIKSEACCQAGQWSRGRVAGTAGRHDVRNPVEAVHLSSRISDADAANQLATGTWKVRVRRGAGGALPGQISQIDGTIEDTNPVNGRLDAGEDRDADGLLDMGGQPFALVIAGPVFGTGAQSWGGASHAPPASLLRLDRYQYSCSDALVATVFDPVPGTITPAEVRAATAFRVVTDRGQTIDEERGIAFAATYAGSRAFASAPLPVRLATGPAGNVTGVPYNGILEGDTGHAIVVTYADSPRPSEARARIRCTPSLLSGVLPVTGGADLPSFVGGGCDTDQYLDRGERVTYTVTLHNYDRDADYGDVEAALTPSGPGRLAVRVLDSPKRIGRLPGGQLTGITFSLFIDPAAVDALSLANRRVTLELTLDAKARGTRLSRTSFTFDHALNSDKESLHYSTDRPAGGREVRDFNRNVLIDRPDVIDPFQQVYWPDEDLVFASMYVPGTPTGLVTNTLGEDLNNNFTLDSGEDIIPNGTLDRGILRAPGGPAPEDLVPWNFDTGGGGFFPLRAPDSRPAGVDARPVWEHQRAGTCGFQTAIPDGDPSSLFQNLGAGIWHTGDGDPATPLPQSNACDNYAYPTDPATPPFFEMLHDVLQSPIVARVRQVSDSRGYPYTVEFQRLGFNLNVQTADYVLAGVDLDNDIDSDARNCLMCNYIYLSRWPDIYELAAFNQYAAGINPLSAVYQRTFGPLTDPNNSVAARRVIDGDETGFSGFTENSNAQSQSPIPTADPDYLPYPVPGVPPICTEGCTEPSICCMENTVAGPIRNFEVVLLEYADGEFYLGQGVGEPEPHGGFLPGPAGNRWQFGFSFVVQEQAARIADYGVGLDDVLLEWDETHPVDEGSFTPPHVPACQRFGRPGEPAGQACATLAVDRLTVYECNDTVEVTVHDPRAIGQPSVTVHAVSDSDARKVPTGATTALHPKKSFPLPAVAGSPGLFRGNVTLGSLIDNPGLLFTSPGTDSQMTFYYLDPLCDGDRDGAATETDFANLDNDFLPAAADNCPYLYNPAQEDGDADGADGVGDLCDNCPGVSNGPLTPGIAPEEVQLDFDADGVGDACDFDDVDFDGIVNSLDNCPDVFNPLQVTAGGASTRGLACSQTGDRDGDGTSDRLDNCVRTPNDTQDDSDRDGTGDACEGDCRNPRRDDLPTGVCSRTNTVICPLNPCPSTGVCEEDPTRSCSASSPQCTCAGITPETCVRTGVRNDGACSTLDDDFDGDGLVDPIDNCPTFPNPPIILGTKRQFDLDSDGLGDPCDPPQSQDDDNNGIPDDALTFTSTLACRKLPQAGLVVLATKVRDLNGDLDAFGDPGEIVRMSLSVRNSGPLALSGVTLILTSDDPDIACVTKGTVLLPDALAPGAAIDTAALGSPAGEFEYIVSPAAETQSASNAARGSFVLTLASNEAIGTGARVPIETLLDLDLPEGAMVTKTRGPDDIAGTGDDGWVTENFDTDRDGDGVITLDYRPAGTEGATNDTIGVWVGTATASVGFTNLSEVACSGFNGPDVDPGCIIDPDDDMDWHIHCPTGECPNATGHVTPTGGNRSFDGRNSLHWGWHFNSASTGGDSTKVRQLAAFMTNPVNLTPFPEAGDVPDLELSFFHMISTMDNTFDTGAPPGQAHDFGDVQYQVDENPDPLADRWGYWDRLVPYQNVYDHIAYVWSTYGGTATYCTFNPTDTGTAPPAPRGVRELICYPSGIWSRCGNVLDQSGVGGCEGPGYPGAFGPGLWVQSKFNLANLLGQRVRIRWLAQAWEFDCCTSSYYEIGGTWANQPYDDGWWIDQIRLTGAVTEQVTPTADEAAPADGACPTRLCDPALGADHGHDLALATSGADADPLVVAGEQVTASAAGTLNPGGCIGGVTQFRFFRDGLMVRDWSSATTYSDHPVRDTTYGVQARCSVAPDCTTATVSRTVPVYAGDGGDLLLLLRHDRATATTTVEWEARTQAIQVSGYDLYAGGIAASGDAAARTLANALCLAGNVPQPPAGPGTVVARTDATTPAAGQARYFLAGHSPTTAGAVAALGLRSDGSVRLPPAACP